MQLKCYSNRALHGYEYIVDGKSASATWSDTLFLEPEEKVFRVWRDVAFQHTGVENGIQFRWKVARNVKQIG
jgi:hypothetical protein